MKKKRMYIFTEEVFDYVFSHREFALDLVETFFGLTEEDIIINDLSLEDLIAIIKNKLFVNRDDIYKILKAN